MGLFCLVRVRLSCRRSARSLLPVGRPGADKVLATARGWVVATAVAAANRSCRKAGLGERRSVVESKDSVPGWGPNAHADP